MAADVRAEQQKRRLREWTTLFGPATEAANTVYLDVETTGLDPLDEPLEIAVVDDTGATIFNSYVQPLRHADWPDAQAVHGISPSDVSGAPPLHQLDRQLTAVLDAADLVVAYNASLDLVYLPAELRLRVKPKMRCAMQAYALWRGDWSSYHGGWRWARLVDAAAAVNFTWPAAPHRAPTDAQAARAVWRWLRARHLGRAHLSHPADT
jgi:DNA polymerase-3 subunit epsilon